MIDSFLGPGYREVSSDRTCTRFLLNYSLERIAAWVTLIAVLVLSYELSESVSVVAAVVLVQVLGRAAVTLFFSSDRRFSATVVSLAAILRIAAIASLILVDSQSDLWWAMLAVAVFAIATGITESAYARMLPSIGSARQVPVLNRLVGRCEQLGAVLGPAVAALVLFVSDERAAFAIAVALSYISLIMLRRFGSSVAGQPDAPRWDNPFTPGLWKIPADLRVVVSGLVVIAALGMIIRVALVETVIDHMGQAGGLYAVLLALVGVGALLGPLPVDRILGHFPANLVLAGGVGVLAAGALIIGLGGPLFIIVPGMLLSGLILVTLDITSAVTIRRSVPDRADQRFAVALVRVILAGQIVGLLAMLILSSTWDMAVAVVILSAICVTLVGVHFLQSGGLKTLGGTRPVAQSRTHGDNSSG